MVRNPAMNAWQPAMELMGRCLKAGIREFVICAGARNAALIEALVRAEAAGHARIWRHFEERSAGFFALGRTMETGLPCAVVTTSGTAAAELLPAVIEAFYQARPLVAITADRPAAYRGTGAPQSIDQTGIFGPHAAQVDPAAWDGRGPLHLNAELEEEFEPGDETFRDVQPGDFKAADERLNVAALARWLREDHFRGVTVMIGGLEPDEQEDVYHFCRDFAAPVVADATSGLREALQGLVIHDPDRTLRRTPPGKILRLGDVPCGRFWRDLENLPETSVWSVCRNGLPGLARESNVTRGPLQRVIPALGDIDEAGDALDLLVGSAARAARMDELLECHPDSEPALVRALSHFACIGSGVFLGNSLPIREWNLFAQWSRPVRPVRANRGANGIDGQISTWLGWSAGIAGSWAVLGDLTTLYDLAAPFVMDQTGSDGRVLAVIRNNGGRIFDRLPRLQSMRPQAATCMTNPHQADFAGLATLWGMRHIRVRNPDDLDQLHEAEEPSVKKAAILLEVIPDASQTAAFWRDWDAMAG